MSPAPALKPKFDRRAIANKAMLASIEARTLGGLDLQSPICPYALCRSYGIQVRFIDISMEGMYQRGLKSRIHLSSLRPLPRRAFTCMHELGHHIFDHGSTIDQLYEGAGANSWDDPDEFLVDVFAGFVMMPTLGLRHAIARRGWLPQELTPAQAFQISCEFGVGYSTLITHMAYTLRMLPEVRVAELRRATPKTIRAALLARPSERQLACVDEHWDAPVLDVEVGATILLPIDTSVPVGTLVEIGKRPGFRLFEATAPGIVRLGRIRARKTLDIRISPTRFVGLAEFRHLEADPDE